MGQEDPELVLDANSQTALSKLKTHLDAAGPYRVWSSPLRRAVSTAKELCNSEDVVVVHGLREWDLGAWQGRTHSDVREEFSGWFEQGTWDPRQPPPGGETLADVLQRVEQAVTAILDETADSAVRNVCVTHNGIIRVMRYLYGDITAERIFEVEEPYFVLCALGGHPGSQSPNGRSRGDG
jgi:probable phosphoglycerate mutase